MGRKIEVKNGDRYNKLTIIKEIEPYIIPSTNKVCRKFLCSCDCGNIIVSLLSKLRNNHTKSCGCIKNQIKIDIKAGDRYNRWIIIEEVDRCKFPGGKVGRMVLCQCDCGNQCISTTK